MKRRRRGTKKKTKVEGKKKKRTMNGSICMVNAVARAEEKTRAEKSHRRWRRGKKGAKKARFRRAWRAKKKNDTPCIVQNEADGGAAKGEKREAMGCIKTPAMKCKISTRSCVAVFRVQAGGKSIRSVTNHDLTRFDSSSFASWPILPFVFPSGCRCMYAEKKESQPFVSICVFVRNIGRLQIDV